MRGEGHDQDMKPLSPVKQWAILVGIIASLIILGLYSEDIAGLWVKWTSPPPKPSAPIRISWRPSKLDSNGEVMQVHNGSSEFLSCEMVVTNFIVQQGTNYQFDVGPNSMKEIGIVECGWSFKSGESIAIGTEGYANMFFKVP